jgi:signal transduction histidine kinase
LKPSNTTHIVRATRALLVLSIVGICLMTCIILTFNFLERDLERTLVNERAHLFIGEQMTQAAKRSELLLYQLGPSGRKETYSQHLKDIDLLATGLTQLMGVMINGGTARELRTDLEGPGHTLALREVQYVPGGHVKPMREMADKIDAMASQLRTDASEMVTLLLERDRCQQQQLPCTPQAVARVRGLYRDMPDRLGPLLALLQQHQYALTEKLLKLETETQSKHRILEQYLGAMSVVVVLLFLAYALSITRRIRSAERQLLDATTALAAASKEKSNFLATMSHEIRTPMNGVIGFTQLLLETRMAPDQRELATHLSNSANSLLGLVNDVLDLSRIEAGGIDFEMQPFAVAKVANSVVSVFANQARQKQIGLQVDIDAAASGIYVGDEVRIRQVLLNLVANAIKFTERGEVRLAVRPLPQGVRFEVRDTGIGVAQDAQKRIFDAYTQADSSTLRQYGGSGLGLTICKELVESMGGTIGIDSQPVEGSCFWFELPLAAGGPLGAPDLEAEPLSTFSGFQPWDGDRASAIVPLRAGSRCMLLVDDTPSNLLVASLMLRRMGYEVDVVESGEQAVEAVQKKAYAVVFMDLQMPGMDGLEATRRIRSLAQPYSAVCIVAMTANAMKSDRDACLAAGMNDFVSKPITLQRLSLCLGRWV